MWVYRGSLPNSQLVVVKRAQQGSIQGAHEFKTEVELLSRVHHKNVVSLFGFCFDAGEQMLVYEYIVNSTLKDSLSGTPSSLTYQATQSHSKHFFSGLFISKETKVGHMLVW